MLGKHHKILIMHMLNQTRAMLKKEKQLIYCLHYTWRNERVKRSIDLVKGRNAAEFK